MRSVILSVLLSSSTAQAQCDVPSGITWRGQTKFLYGANYAWHNFAADFGGSSTKPGVAANEEVIEAELTEMKRHGAQVVRWFVLPDLRGNGVVLDKSGHPIGLGGTIAEDLDIALRIAEKLDMYFVLTLFSFDGFREPNKELYRIVTNNTKRRMLLNKVVRPLIKISKQFTKTRIISWDLFNEPEWATFGPGIGGDPAFEPLPAATPIPYELMAIFLAELSLVVKAETNAPVTIGAASLKWQHAWLNIPQDYYTFHYYDWMIGEYPPLPAEEIGLKPLVIGELPLAGLGGHPLPNLLQHWMRTLHYAGALAWSYSDPDFEWNRYKSGLSYFKYVFRCETTFSDVVNRKTPEAPLEPQ